MDSVRDGQAETPDDHQRPRELIEGETLLPPEDNTRNEEARGQDELGAAEQGQAGVDIGSRDYYITLYSQFTNVVMMSAFLGGLEAAILSFLHDVLSDGPLGKQLFRQGEKDSVHLIYSFYSMGLMLGLISVSLSLTAAIVAAVNAAIACQLSLHTSRPILMEKRVVLCIFLQFWGLVCAGLSLFLLCLSLSATLTALIMLLLILGVGLSFSHVLPISGLRRVKVVRFLLPCFSLGFSFMAVALDIASPSESSWITIAVAGFTVARLVWTLHPALLGKSTPGLWKVTLGLATAWAVLISLRVLALELLRSFDWVHEDLGSTYGVFFFAAAECLMLLGVGIKGYIRARRRSHSAQSDEQNGVAP